MSASWLTTSCVLKSPLYFPQSKIHLTSSSRGSNGPQKTPFLLPHSSSQYFYADRTAQTKLLNAKSITHHSYSHTSTLNRCSESSDSVSSDLAEIASVEKIANSEVACHTAYKAENRENSSNPAKESYTTWIQGDGVHKYIYEQEKLWQNLSLELSQQMDAGMENYQFGACKNAILKQTSVSYYMA